MRLDKILSIIVIILSLTIITLSIYHYFTFDYKELIDEVVIYTIVVTQVVLIILVIINFKYEIK